MTYPTVGDYLYGAQGYRMTGHMSSVPVALVPTVSSFNPTKPWNGVDTGDMFFSRYGCLNMGWKDGDTAAWQDSFKARYSQSAFSNGTLAPSHLTAPGILPDLLKLCRRADNPLQLVGNATYTPNLQDAQDCLMLVRPQATVGGGMNYITAWQAVMEPLLAKAQPVQSPPAPPGGPIVQPPVVTTPPPPIVPPAPVQGLQPWSPAAQRAEELRVIAKEALFGSPDLLEDLFDQAGALDRVAINAVGVGWDSFKPLIVKLVKVSRLARKRRGDPRAIPPGDL